MEQPASPLSTTRPADPEPGLIDRLLLRLPARAGLAAIPWTLAMVVALAGPPVYDQELLLDSVDLRAGRFPSPDHGVASAWFFGLAELSGLEGVGLQILLQALGAAIYLGGLALLARAWLADPAHRALVPLVLAASLFPYVWYTPDLLAAGLLFAALAALRTGAGPGILAALLTLMGLARPEMALTAVVLGGAWVAWRRPGWSAALRAGLTAALLTGAAFAPPLAWYGPAYLDDARTYLDDSREAQNEGIRIPRSLYAFIQHHAELVGEPATPAPAPKAFGDWTWYYERDFPGVTSLPQALAQAPGGYPLFLGRSVVRSGAAAFAGLNTLVLALVGLALAVRGGARPFRRADLLLALPLVALVPIVLLTYLKLRYMARFFPLALVLVLAGRERLLRDGATDGPGWRLVRLGLDGTLVMQAIVTLLLLAFHVPLRGSGFPD